MDIFNPQEPLIFNLLRNNVTLVNYTPGEIILAEKIPLPDHFIRLIKEKTNKIFNTPWNIIINKSDSKIDSNSLEEHDDEKKQIEIKNFTSSEEFKQIQTAFPNASITDVKLP